MASLHSSNERSLSEHYELHDVIGTGSYGQAVLAKCKSDGAWVVVKQIKYLDMSEKEKAEALHEVHVLSQFDHLNVIQYLDCFIEVG